MRKSRNLPLFLFSSILLVISMFFFSNDAEGLTIVYVNLDKSAYELGDIPYVSVKDPTSNLDPNQRDFVNAEVRVLVAQGYAGTIKEIIQIQETDVNSGNFEGVLSAITLDDFTDNATDLTNTIIKVTISSGTAQASLIAPPEPEPEQPTHQSSEYTAGDSVTDCPIMFDDYYLDGEYYNLGKYNTIECNYVNDFSSVEKSHFASFSVHYLAKGYDPVSLAEPECMNRDNDYEISSSSRILTMEISDGYVPAVKDAAKKFFNQLLSLTAECPTEESSSTNDSSSDSNTVTKSAPEPTPEPEPTPDPVPKTPKDNYSLLEECKDFEIILRKKIETIEPGKTASYPIFIGHTNPTCNTLQKHVTVAMSFTLDSNKLRQDGDWGFPIITTKSIANTAPFDTTLKIFTLPTIPEGQYLLTLKAEDSTGHQKTENFELFVQRSKPIISENTSESLSESCPKPTVTQWYDGYSIVWKDDGTTNDSKGIKIGFEGVVGEMSNLKMDCNSNSLTVNLDGVGMKNMFGEIFVTQNSLKNFNKANLAANSMSISANEKNVNFNILKSSGQENTKFNFLLLPGTKSLTISNLSIMPESQIKSESSSVLKEKVPNWIKTNAKWWADGQIGDSDFVSGVEFLIKERTFVIDNLPERASEMAQEKIPDWIKNNAKWWADGLIGEDDFLNGIKYLVEIGKIRVN